MTIRSTNGVFTPAVREAEKLQRDGTLSAADAAHVVEGMTAQLKNEYDGASSSAGLARDRDVMVATAAAIVDKGNLGGAARQVFEETFGKQLDGKSEALKELLSSIRSQARGDRGYSYSA
jgi:hypothetical protein